MRQETTQPDIYHSSKIGALCRAAKRTLSSRPKILIALAVTLSLLLVPSVHAQQQQQFPPTEKKPVSDEYHGTKVIDDYRWLEDLSAPAVRKWNDEQNRFSRSMLEKIPARPAISTRLKDIYSNEPVTYYYFYQRRMFFALKSQPPKNQPLLVMLKSPDDLASEQVILDLNVVNPKGTTAIDFYVPSLDGRLVAVSLSDNGSEDGSVHVYETATGKKLPDVIPRVQYATAGGSVAWNKDASGFYYTRYPQGNERPKSDMNFYQQVYFHKLGTSPSEDTYVIGKDFPRIAEIQLRTTEDAGYLLASVANGDGGEFAHYLLGPSGSWTQITHFSDHIRSVSFGLDGRLYLLSLSGAPRGKILSMPLENPRLSKAKTIIPESDVTINYFVPAPTRLYVGEMVGGPSEVRIFDLKGKPQTSIPTKPVSSVGIGVRLEGDEILFGSESYVQPFAWYRFNPTTGKITKTRLAGNSVVNFDDAQVVRDFATSKDGTKVPINIISRKGTKLNGQNPTILYGYGGYAVNQTPFFWSRNRVWLDAGGVYVFANLRGGAEYGDEWHKAGNLTRKQNVFDDFVACAQYLIDKKYTSPNKLAIEGGSNGGLLMGAALTQHPELFRAVVSHVGIYDMLRVELSPNGAFNVTEFGTVKDPEQFRALYAYSPYHHIKDNTAYPAVLFLTGDNDGRVDPMQSRKMTARLQAATSSKLSVFLRTSSDTGHGIGTGLGARIAEESDVFAFLFDQLEINDKTISK
jgi:prolyl oligopeptidase